MKFGIAIILLCLVPYSIDAQEPPKGLESLQFLKIAETYKLTPDLSYDFTVTYADSANPSALLEQMPGRSKIHDGKYWTMLDSMELVQGGRYNLAIQHQDSLIIINSRQEYTSVLQMPFTDSLFLETQVEDMHMSTANDSTWRIEVTFKPGTYYKGYTISFGKEDYFIREIKYFLPDEGAFERPGSSGTAVVTVRFSNYSQDPVDDSWFDESKFVYRQGDEFLLKAPFTGFQVMVNGVMKTQ